MDKASVSSRTFNELDEAREKEDLKKLEAVFFVSGRFLDLKELVSLSDLNPIIVRELIEKLKERYEQIDSAIEIVEKKSEDSEMWKMDVKQDYTEVVNKLATGSSEFTKAEQETLAIVAFKQPIKQSVIIKIRGNKAYDHIKKFSDLGLIKKKKIGHTNELSLADDFYDYFSASDGESVEINKKLGELESGEGENSENGKEESVSENVEENKGSVSL